MATKLRLKKSSVVGKKPEASDLDYGELAINYQDGNLYYKNADNDIKSLQESPVEFTAKNESGFPVTKGQAVYINGVSGTNPTIALADADNASAMPAFGLLKASANNNAEVIIITSGNLTGLNTSSFAVGDTLYVSTTPGAITNVKPAGEASLIQNIGKVVRSHGSAGIIKVGGAGRTAATPNLNSGNIFIGNDSNYASTTSMQTETRKHIVSGTGVGYDSASGVISIGQDVGTTSDVTFGKVTGDSGDFDIIKLNTTQWNDVNVPDNLPAFQEGNLFYFQGPDALTYSNHKINIKLGQDEITRVYNNTGSTIAKGQAVYVTGATNDFPTIALARANSFNTVYETMGLTSNEILNGEFGYVTVRGLYGGLNTAAFSPGDFVHVSPDDPGTLVNYSPTYPNFAYEMGVVLVSDSATGGNVGGCIQIQPHSEIFETLRGIGETRFDGDLTVAGSLTVLGSQTTVGQSNVTQGAPFYRLNEGDAIGEAGTTFTGSGLDDAFFAGHFTGPSEQSYYVRIDGVGTGTGGVDTFKVALGTDSAFTSPILTGVDITGSAQLIHSTDNISVDFTATTGHTINDTWKGTASPINVDTGFFTNRNTGTSGVGYTHMGFFFDASDEKWKVIDEYDSVPTGIIEVTDSSLGTLVADTFEGSFTGNLTGSASQFGGLNTTQFLRSDTADTKTSGDLSFSDNVKAVFGAGSDLQIYHDATTNNSIIAESGTGDLQVLADNFAIKNAANTSPYINGVSGAQVRIYYGGSEKLATTSTGIDVTGNMVGDGLSVSSGGNTLASTGNNLEFNRASGSSFIDQVGSGGSLTFRTTSSQTNRLKIENNGDINFYDSVGSGAELVWDTSALYLNAKDGVKSTYGDTNDLQIYHDGSNSYIDDQGTGRLYIKASDLYIQDDDADDIIRAEGGNNGVKLYYNGIQRLETTSSGIDVSGTVEGARGLFSGNFAGVTVDNTGVGAHTILMKNLEGSILFSHDDGALSINTGGAADGTGTTTAITVDSNQYVGIGVTSPTQVLDVVGNIAVSGTVDGRDIATDGTKLDTIDTSANNYSHPNHSGEVTSTGDGATVIADNVVDEANLKVSNSPTNGYFLSAQSGNTGGLTWAAVPPGYADSDVGVYIAGNRTYGNITTTGYIAGPATMTIDPAGVGDNTGTVVIAGDLQVDGTTTTINSTTVTVDDLNLTLASGAANAAAANGAGITVDGASATITYDATNDEWDFNKDINVSSRVLVGEVKASANQTFTHGTGNTVNFRNSSAVSRLFIKGDGDVGIGTNNPVAKLVVSKGGDEGWEIDPGLIDSNHNRITNFNRATSQYCNLTTDALGFNYRISGSANAGLSMTANGLESKSASYNILNIRTDMDDNGSSDDGIIKITNGSSNTTKAELRWDESEDLVHISYGDHGRHISINSSGNVGIGTGSTSPTEKLVVTGSINSSNQSVNFSTGDHRVMMDIVNSSKIARIGTVTGTATPTGTQGEVSFLVNGSEKMRLNADGNGGLGTTDPSPDYGSDVALEIKGTSSPGLVINDTGQASKYGIHADANDLKITYGTGTLATFQNDGNVGIGTSGPQGVLDLGASSLARSITWSKYNNVYSSYSEGSLNLTSNYYGNTSANDYKTSSTATYGAAGIEISGTGGTSNSGIMSFFVDPQTAKTADAAFVPTERMRISSDGFVGIGATNADAPLTIQPAAQGIGTNNVQNWMYALTSGSEFDLKLNQIVSSGLVKYGFNLRNNGTSYDNNLVLDRGSVGIGEATPSSGVSSNETALHITDANVPALVLDNTGNFGDKYAIYANTSGNLKFLNVDTNYTGIEITDGDTVKLSGHVDHADGSRQMVGNISTSSTSQTTLASFTRHSYGGGEIMIIAREATTERRHITKLLVVHDEDGDGTSGPIATEYGTMATDGNLFSVDVGTAGTGITIRVTPTTTNSLTFRYKMDLLED